MIPKILHQVWVGDNPMPQDQLKWCRQLQDMHPEWEYCLWDDASILDCLLVQEREPFNCCATASEKSDLIRWVALSYLGGFYLDTDVEPIKPFDPLCDTEVDLLACAYHDPAHGLTALLPTVIACPMGSPIAERCFRETVGRLKTLPSDTPSGVKTGTVLDTLWHRSAGRNMQVVPSDYFYPIPHNKVAYNSAGDNHLEFDRSSLPAETYCVHHWKGSWHY